jgi:hypothetical protein
VFQAACQGRPEHAVLGGTAMKRAIAILLALLLFVPSAPKASAGEGGSAKIPESLYGTYAFLKQLYMNPLSSFMAFDGFEEYYELTENTLAFIDASGQMRSMDIAWQEEPVDSKAYESSFMMEGFGIPDISAYKNMRQFTLASAGLENIVYRIYLMDDEVWLANIHKDTAHLESPEYIWSIFRIEKYDVSLSVRGTQEGVKGFLALLKDAGPQMYESDTCYNITPDDILKATGYRVFKFDTSCATYLLFENGIYPLGEWLGGLGVVSMAAVDLDEDGQLELYFTYSFGSGLHRSHAGYFDPVLKQAVPLSPAMPGMDMIVLTNKTGGLSLYEAAFPFSGDFVNYKALGTKHIADITFENGKIVLKPMPQGN